MTQQTNSRFITYPSIEPKSSNSHTLLLVDATTEDVINIGMFCKVSSKNYDVYLYHHETSDLEWLNHISGNLDAILIKDESPVKITASNVQRVGEGQENVDFMNYFQMFDQT